MAKKDPACGMSVSEDSLHVMEYSGQRYRFCSDVCLQKFEVALQKHLRVTMGVLYQLFGILLSPIFAAGNVVNVNRSER